MEGYWINHDKEKVIVMNIYGWTAADEKEESAEKTDDLLCIVLEELATWEDPFFAIVGDLNGDLKRFPVLQDMIIHGQIVDLGENAVLDSTLLLGATASTPPKARDSRPVWI